MLELVFVLSGIVILVKGKVAVRAGCELQGRAARSLGLLYLGILPFDVVVFMLAPSQVFVGCTVYGVAAAVATLGVVLFTKKQQLVAA